MSLQLERDIAWTSEALVSESFLARPGVSVSPKNKSLCFVLHLQGVELAHSTHCFTLEDINGKAPVLGTCMGMDIGVSFMGRPLVDQKHRSGQIEAVLICSLCQQDVQDIGA